ncbi:hypothetical protein B0T19DRAFT_440798 [Cercophora scortea]|uniref:Uncharacterized protein n=1 Tax=Cercophora scortea TaxID=314031 RepID=A0AAE0J059_9PEZI|nr:hypothetical protein B0T19DRAFT_440798 [Cercophora scortea]
MGVWDDVTEPRSGSANVPTVLSCAATASQPKAAGFDGPQGVNVAGSGAVLRFSMQFVALWQRSPGADVWKWQSFIRSFRVSFVPTVWLLTAKEGTARPYPARDPNNRVELETHHGINLNMCSWEQTLYACGHRGKLRRMKYSCTIYTRFIYGECRYDSRHDRVYDVISYDDCSDCRRLFEFVNL